MWSELHTRKGEQYLKTLLKRAGKSPLDVVLYPDEPDTITTILLPKFQQIKHLRLKFNWHEVFALSQTSPGPLPNLHSLEITQMAGSLTHHPWTPPATLKFFEGATNLAQFTFRSRRLDLLERFVFPNLSTFELSNYVETSGSDFSALLTFLGASPMLGSVKVDFGRKVELAGVPQGNIVTLPNVKTLSFSLAHGPAVYGIEAHILCPGARYVSLNNVDYFRNVTPGSELFPAPTSWGIILQHCTSPAKEVTIEINGSYGKSTACSLTFLFMDETTIELGFTALFASGSGGTITHPEQMACKLLLDACRSIQDYPGPTDIKHLHIKCEVVIGDPCYVSKVVEELGRLASHLEPLDKLTLHGCVLHVCLLLPPCHQGFSDPQKAIPFPQTQELTISNPLMSENDEGDPKWLDGIVERAKLQHDRGIPFKRVVVCAGVIPDLLFEKLDMWVHSVDCSEKEEYRWEQDF